MMTHLNQLTMRFDKRSINVGKSKSDIQWLENAACSLVSFLLEFDKVERARCGERERAYEREREEGDE